MGNRRRDFFCETCFGYTSANNALQQLYTLASLRLACTGWLTVIKPGMNGVISR